MNSLLQIHQDLSMTWKIAIVMFIAFFLKTTSYIRLYNTFFTICLIYGG